MAFESVQITSTRNGVSPVVGSREDLAVADLVVVGLTSYVGVSSVQWVLKGRPEGSSVGGSGPEPIAMGTAQTASFTVDADQLPYHMDGTYVIEAVINPGSPGEVRRTALLARLSGLFVTGPGGVQLPLRKMGGFEALEDNEKPLIFQGWKTQAIRWLEYFRQNGGGGGGGGVIAISAGPGISITGTGTNPIVNNTGVLTVSAGTNVTVTGTAQNPIISSIGGGGGGAANTLFRRANITGMVAIDTSVFLTSDAHICEVLTVGDFYGFVPGSTVVVDGITVIADGGALGRWVRLNLPNRTFAAAAFWAIDEVSGNDENAGWGANQAAADAVPLRTVAELNRRLTGAVWSSNVQVHQLTDLTACVPLTNPRATAPSVTGVWLGVPAQVFPAGTGTTPVTSFAAQNPAGNTGAQLQLSALPTSWTASALLDLLVQSSDGLRTAVAQADLGSKTARLTTVSTADASTGNPGVPSTFTNGEGVRVLRPLALPCYPFGAQIRGRVAYCTVTAPSVNFATAVGASSQIMLGKISGARLVCAPGHTVFLSAVQCATGNFLSGGSFAAACIGVKNSVLAVNGVGVLAVNHTPMDFENARVALSEKASVIAFGTDSSIGIFNLGAGLAWLSGDALHGNPLRLNANTLVYGSGNTPEPINLPAGATITMAAVAGITVTTAAPSPLILAGASYAWADLPVADLLTGSFANLG